MRILRINNETVDIDDNTSIGINIQSFSVAEPEQRFISNSNSFSIPLTAKNYKIFGFAGNPQATDTGIYDLKYCDYFIDSIKLIDSGQIYVTEISDRINLSICANKTIFDDLKEYKWNDFVNEFLIWQYEFKNLPSPENPYVGTFYNFCTAFANSTDGILLSYYIGNLALFDAPNTAPAEYIETIGNIWLQYQFNESSTKCLGGHFSIFIKSIFEFLEYKYGYDFGTQDPENDNIFSDAVAKQMHVPARSLGVEYNYIGGTFAFEYGTGGVFEPYQNTEDKNDKTIYDIVKAFILYFNLTVVLTFDSKTIRLRRFDEIANAPIIDWSNKITGETKFKPIIDNYNQNNIIGFGKVYEGGNELQYSKNIICKNKNVNVGGSDSKIITIDTFIPSFVYSVPYLAKEESLNEIQFFVKGVQQQVTVNLSQEGNTTSAIVFMYTSAIYSLDDEYTLLQSVIEYPKIYEIKAYLSLIDIINLKHFARYYIKELNGYFILDKVTGFNPDKTDSPTTVTLIKL